MTEGLVLTHLGNGRVCHSVHLVCAVIVVEQDGNHVIDAGSDD